MGELQEENRRLRGERDLLRRRLAELEANFLHTVNDSQREILAVNDALAVANAQLQELDRMKDAFLSMVTHELRTPLTVISGTTEMFEAGIYGELTAVQSEMIRQIALQAHRLRQLVNDLLDLSKMESGMMRLRPEMLDPHSLAAATIEQLTTVAAQAGVTLRNQIGHGLPEVNCDGQRIEQVLTNLVSNAIKFTPANGQVTIFAKAESDSVRFIVEDTGHGIPVEALPRVFDKFFQVQSSTESGAKGTGLGLAIVKHIVELHGGEAEAESETGRGSRFSFTLPR
ncbi:MAG: HAMP domain-containing histidine kinase [Acidobacteriota bacterium]|nr:HAMP domain-containing histidine kinase [Acidobacteriota bacterium]